MPRSKKANKSRKDNLQIAREELMSMRQRRSGASSVASAISDNYQSEADEDPAVHTRPASPDVGSSCTKMDVSESEGEVGRGVGGTEAKFRLKVPSDFGSKHSGESIYLEWTILTNPEDIDGHESDDDDAAASNENIHVDTDDNSEAESTGNEEDDGIDLDGASYIREPGHSMLNNPDPQVERPVPSTEIPNTSQTTSAPNPPPKPILPGYKYTEFVPNQSHHDSKDRHLVPTLSEAQAALDDLKKSMHPKNPNGHGYKQTNVDLWRRVRMIDGMFSMLNMFTNPKSYTYKQWGASARQAAIGLGRGSHCARRLSELNRAYLSDRELLPLNPQYIRRLEQTSS